MLNSTDASNLDAVRTHTTELIHDAVDADRPVLIEGPPASGKTTSAYELALEREEPITYLASRIDLYEQAEEWCEDQGDIDYVRIPAPQRDCPTFADENEGSATAVKKLYERGYSAREIHLQFPDLAPCGKSCDYYQRLERIDEDIDSIDFLIGHHTHSYRHQYVRNRIVIIDEFNADPFLSTFPEEDSGVIDNPGEIIPTFLKKVGEHDEAFPGDAFQDITDVLQNRNDPGHWFTATNWFRDDDDDDNSGASRRDAQRFDFFKASADDYDSVHAYAPFLTFSLLCMDRIGPGIELAPPPDGRLNDLWEAANLSRSAKCLRDRNTGTMYSLQPPDLSPAKQVIALDGTPTIELWNLLFAPKTGFDHQQVISRDDFVTYLESAMNLSLTQIGGGMHPYAGGRVSDLDKKRFATILAREDEQFALISTKKALKRYNRKGWLKTFVKTAERNPLPEDDSSELFEGYRALNYGMIRSSNEFGKEALGVIAGMPFPSDDLIRIWAGFCGEPVEIGEKDGEEDERSFGEFGNKIYRHFAHHQVVQAVLRFGRDESVYGDDGATVYISTEALPEWFEVDNKLKVRSKSKESAVVFKLYEMYQSADRPPLASVTVSTLYERIEEDKRFPEISKKGTRNALERQRSEDHISFRKNAGKNSADVYRWDGNGQVIQRDDGDENDDSKYLLVTKSVVYSFEHEGSG